jgi:hypothetical protein
MTEQIKYPTEEQLLNWNGMLTQDAAGKWTLVGSSGSMPYDMLDHLEGLVALALIGIQNTRG